MQCKYGNFDRKQSCDAEEGYCETASVFQAFFHIEIESLDWYMGALTFAMTGPFIFCGQKIRA